MKAKRYKLHWGGQDRLSPSLKWQIWDWTLRCPVVHLESRALGRMIARLLDEQDKKVKGRLAPSEEP